MTRQERSGAVEKNPSGYSSLNAAAGLNDRP
jgi:hypothetical protein